MKKSFMPMKNMVLYYSFASPNTGMFGDIAGTKDTFSPCNTRKSDKFFRQSAQGQDFWPGTVHQ
jgi:hypothetical protein